MSNRFEAIGSFVYEKGNRIGVTLDEASVELARKLNAYQMRVERLKAEVERLRASSFVTAVPVEQYERVIKAGDAMADYIERTEASAYDIEADGGDRIADWSAAKEGKPSV